MSVGERDPYTGHMTTGHEWNGIKELNAPVPKAVLFFLAVTFLFSLGYWILMPAWPTGVAYTRGLLGIDQRTTVAESMAAAAQGRAGWAQKVSDGDYAAIQADTVLMRTVRQTGHTLFGDNCAVCHGQQGQGGKGYPAIAKAPWLWGGEPETLAETIRVGINATHPDTRVSQMMAFGRDKVLERPDLLKVAAYVHSLSQKTDASAATLQEGKVVFDANCVACHGDDAKGKRDVGAPDLTDAFWIYGSDLQGIYSTIYDGRQGQMPGWENRLSPLERKILTLYLLDLRKKS
ncbi:cytochrome-c oxidase, cbb3-type subunit III [Ferrovibrio terrae]|uniref:Cbb3-type cytochrome c oxidase subunit n=1 Tax=Ferrovibrio terrae TaxID=2594003 RepID=A0A516H6T2_9PROT|nr:cytochrome-c oxidase, cbb3-type subunit III [Ferrovibrio terrae]QDO99431.1 cytochrome-c oxidase, cbb3-type subunit III [Ferrovibrio terrae]